MNHDSMSFRFRLLINRRRRIGVVTDHDRLDQQYPLGRQDWTYRRLIGYWVAIPFRILKTLDSCNLLTNQTLSKLSRPMMPSAYPYPDLPGTFTWNFGFSGLQTSQSILGCDISLAIFNFKCNAKLGIFPFVTIFLHNLWSWVLTQ